jgi:serine/threonine protein kinase
LREIGKKIADALDFVHERGYNHNDVSPKNILFDELKREAFLIDFGLASSDTETIKGFRGTPRYTDQAVFRKYPSKQWTSKPKYDKSSLAFSMATLSQRGKKHLWKSFQPFDLSDSRNSGRLEDWEAWVKKRSNVAWTRLAKFGFEEDVWKPFCSDGGKSEN